MTPAEWRYLQRKAKELGVEIEGSAVSSTMSLSRAMDLVYDLKAKRGAVKGEGRE